MRAKRCCFILILLITVCLLFIWYNSPTQSTTAHIKNIVSKTQLHIKNINSVLNNNNDNNNGGNNVNDIKKELDVESTYLELLGFTQNPKLYDKNEFNLNQTIFATAFTQFTENEKYLIESKLKYFPNHTLYIYDIDLSFSEQLKIQKLCNRTCKLKTFKTEKYPSHIKQIKLKAYKPIIIQEVLNEHDYLAWIESTNLIISNKIEKYINKSFENGLAVWQSKEPITRLTHPTMFKYFNVKQKDFFFTHMLDTSVLFLVNKPNIHYNLMYPWIKCALKEDCIAPPGAQLNGCEFDRRPEFLYSGCHRYESSAFSVISSILFNFDSQKYIIDEDLSKNEFFTSVYNFILSTKHNSQNLISQFISSINNNNSSENDGCQLSADYYFGFQRVYK